MSHPFNPLNSELNPICHLLALLGAHHILHVSRRRVNKENNLQVFETKIGEIIWSYLEYHRIINVCDLCRSSCSVGVVHVGCYC